MEFIGIAIIIIMVMGSVHFVHRKAYQAGIQVGIDKGRVQVLEENLIREKNRPPEFDNYIQTIVDHANVKDYSDLHSQIQADKKDRRSAVIQ